MQDQENAQFQTTTASARTIINIKDTPYDITDLGIDMSYLTALPEDFQEEAVLAAIAAQRSQVQPGEDASRSEQELTRAGNELQLSGNTNEIESSKPATETSKDDLSAPKETLLEQEDSAQDEETNSVGQSSLEIYTNLTHQNNRQLMARIMARMTPFLLSRGNL